MRYLFFLCVLLGLNTAQAQENQVSEQFAIHLSLNERYRDTLNWDTRILQAVEAQQQLILKLESEGKLVLAGSIDLPPRAPEYFELLVLRPMTQADARIILQQLPVVRAGMVRARLYPFKLNTTLPAALKED